MAPANSRRYVTRRPRLVKTGGTAICGDGCGRLCRRRRTPNTPGAGSPKFERRGEPVVRTAGCRSVAGPRRTAVAGFAPRGTRDGLIETGPSLARNLGGALGTRVNERHAVYGSRSPPAAAFCGWACRTARQARHGCVAGDHHGERAAPTRRVAVTRRRRSRRRRPFEGRRSSTSARRPRRSRGAGTA